MIFDLQIFENARAGVSEDFVRGGQKAGGLSVAEHPHQVRVRFIVAIVEAIGARPVATGTNVVTDSTEIGEFDVQTFAVGTSQRLGREFANEFSSRICMIQFVIIHRKFHFWSFKKKEKKGKIRNTRADGDQNNQTANEVQQFHREDKSKKSQSKIKEIVVNMDKKQRERKGKKFCCRLTDCQRT